MFTILFSHIAVSTATSFYQADCTLPPRSILCLSLSSPMFLEADQNRMHHPGFLVLWIFCWVKPLGEISKGTEGWKSERSGCLFLLTDSYFDETVRGYTSLMLYIPPMDGAFLFHKHLVTPISLLDSSDLDNRFPWLLLLNCLSITWGYLIVPTLI